MNHGKCLVALMALASFVLPGGCQKQQAAPAPVPEVITVAIQPQQVELTTELPGRTSVYRVSEIRPQVNGIIQKRQFREGSDVKAGQLLYQIDPAPFQVALDSARASLAKAQANLLSIRSRARNPMQPMRRPPSVHAGGLLRLFPTSIWGSAPPEICSMP
ncbi:MAG: biotin/lipoyl-binding protein [Syntrophobacteraceae bacterium]